MSIDRKAAEAAIAAFLEAMGQAGSELAETPARVTAAFADELLVGDSMDVATLILEGSDRLSGESDPVLVDGIFTATVCPHHMLVAQGTSLVAYQPGERVLGLGTIARLVRACSRRLVLQEEIAQSIVEALMTHAGARGAFCRIELNHTCLQARGAEEHAAKTVTWSGQGSLREPAHLEAVLGRALSATSVPELS